MSLMASSSWYGLQNNFESFIRARFIGNESTGAISTSTAIDTGSIVSALGMDFNTDIGPTFRFNLSTGGRVDIAQTPYSGSVVPWSSRFWFYPTVSTAKRLVLIHAKAPGTLGTAGSASARVDIANVNATNIRFSLLSSTTGGAFDNGNTVNNTAFPINTWHHIALVFDTNLRFYVNGSLLISTNAASPNFRTGRHLLGAGSDGAGTGYEGTRFQGYMQDFEVFEGMSLYTANFTPPARTALSGGSLILDQLTAAVAYSFRKLRTAYTGFAIEVRRSSDNAVSNIGFVGGVLDTASLLTFVGANNGFISKWYDQSGNGLTAAQTTLAHQPQIVSAGVVNVQNAKPTATYASQRLVTATQALLASAGSSSTMNAVARRTASANMNVVGYGAPATNQVRGIGSSFLQLQYLMYGSGDLVTTANNPGTTNAFIQTATYTSTQISGFLNGVATTPATKAVTPATPNNTSLFIGAIPPGTANFWTGNIQEIVLFNDALSSTDRASLESNQNTFYLTP